MLRDRKRNGRKVLIIYEVNNEGFLYEGLSNSPFSLFGNIRRFPPPLRLQRRRRQGLDDGLDGRCLERLLYPPFLFSNRPATRITI
jgi:hypothetical protein